MKIVMLCEFYGESVEFQENLLTKYYARNGHDVTVITSTFDSIFDYYNDRHDSSRPRKEFVDNDARIIRLPYRYNFLNRLRAYTNIYGILEDAAPDLIYIHDIMPNIPEAIRYKRAHPGSRMILDYHADYSNSGRGVLSRRFLHGVLRKRFLDMVRPHLSRIFPVVPASAVFLHEVYGVPHDEMELLPLGADMEMARRIMAEAGRDALRDRYGFEKSDLVIFTGGKLTPNRRTEVLIEAVKRAGNPRLRVVIVGDSAGHDRSYREYLESLAVSRTDIRFAGWLSREDIYRHMEMADLAVFPAGQSILWQQSIAMGLPLIVGDIGWQDISYLNLANNIVVLRREDINPGKLSDAIGYICGDRRRLAQMASGARTVADEHLDWDKLIMRTLRFNS